MSVHVSPQRLALCLSMRRVCPLTSANALAAGGCVATMCHHVATTVASPPPSPSPSPSPSPPPSAWHAGARCAASDERDVMASALRKQARTPAACRPALGCRVQWRGRVLFACCTLLVAAPVM